MANLKPTTTPVLSQAPPPKTQSQFKNQSLPLKPTHGPKILGAGTWVLSGSSNGGRMVMMGVRGRSLVCCSAPAGEVGVSGDGGVGQGPDGRHLVREFGWGARRMARTGDEMKRVAEVQAEAFHVPVALFNDVFLEFFKAEVLSALIYKLKNSPPDRYACLVAESLQMDSSPWAQPEALVGVVDVTVQREEDVSRHLDGTEEYLYVSGIAVLTKYRRQRIATVLLKACDILSIRWGYRYLALRAYEDDVGARKLYTKAGYKVVSGDPHWVTWIGRKRRIIMIKPSFVPETPYN